MSETVFDVVFIGTGPGGYVGAIRAAQLGLKTAVIEKDKTYGGTCLNVGCIPSKALLESSELYHLAHADAKSHGIEIGELKVNLAQMMARKSKIVKDLTGGISFLFKKNKIETFKGHGRIQGPNEIKVTDSDLGERVVKAKNIVIATGSVPTELPGLPFDEKKIVSSTGALELETIPKKMIVVGGGVIGLELTSVWARLGTEVTVIEYADQICSMMDQQMIQVLKKSLEKQKVVFKTSCRVTGSAIDKNQVVVTYEDMKSNEKINLSAEVVLVSSGRRPFTEGLGLEELGIEKDKRGFVQVNSHWQTKVPSIYAIGDATPGPMLAHKAEEEGVAVAEFLATGHGHVNYSTVPSVIYTFPEVASVGLTEEECKQKGLSVNVGTFPFLANGRAKALGATDGLVKIIALKDTDKIVGGHIVGPRASELLGEIVVCMEFGGSSEDLARSFHAHPTLNEVVREAALAVDRRARQM